MLICLLDGGVAVARVVSLNKNGPGRSLRSPALRQQRSTIRDAKKTSIRC